MYIKKIRTTFPPIDVLTIMFLFLSLRGLLNIIKCVMMKRICKRLIRGKNLRDYENIINL